MCWVLSIIAMVVGLSLCPPLVDLPSAWGQPGLSRSALSGDGPPRLDAAYGRQPLHFERTDGQDASRITYIARGQGYTLLIAPGEVVLRLQHRDATTERGRDTRLDVSSPAVAPPFETTTLRMEMVGGNRDARATSLDALPGRSNYFIGNDPSQWRTNVPHYAKVRLASVYPGIDLVFYGTGRQLEHDFIVTPGADPRQIQLAFAGADRVSLTPKGDLVLALPGGDLILHAPVAYQDSAGGRVPVPARFVVADNQQVGFDIAAI